MERETGTQNPDLPHEFAWCAHVDCRWDQHRQSDDAGLRGTEHLDDTDVHCAVCGLGEGAEVHRRRPERSLREAAAEEVVERERGS